MAVVGTNASGRHSQLDTPGKYDADQRILIDLSGMLSALWQAIVHFLLELNELMTDGSSANQDIKEMTHFRVLHLYKVSA